MKTKLLALLTALLLLLSFTACAQRSEAPSSSASDLSSALEQEEPGSPPRVEEMTLEEVRETYVAPLYNLVYADWASPQDIHRSAYYWWHMDYINDRVPYEERLEKYSRGENNGWFYPAEEYEANIQRYFDISIDYLRTNDDPSHPLYLSQENCYHIPTGPGGMIANAQIDSLEDISVDGDLITIRVGYPDPGDPDNNIYKMLTVQTSPEGFQYKSLQTIE